MNKEGLSVANQNACQDDNQFPALVVHSGTAGTATTARMPSDRGNIKAVWVAEDGSS